MLLLPPLSPQLLHVVSFPTLPNLLRLGQTCRCLQEVCDSEAAWCHLCTPLPPAAASAWPCKRAAIINCESALANGGRGWHFVPQPVMTSLRSPLQTLRACTSRAWAAAGSER